MLNVNRSKPAVDPDEIVEPTTTPTQDIIMYLLWSQYRHGRTLISIPAKLTGSVDKLERLGYVWTKHGVAQGTIEIGLDKAGIDLMDPNLRTPLQEKYEAAQVEIRELRNALVHRGDH